MVELVNVDEDGDPCGDIRCPFGSPGDVLAGKEAWEDLRAAIRDESTRDGLGTVSYRADGLATRHPCINGAPLSTCPRGPCGSTSASRR